MDPNQWLLFAFLAQFSVLLGAVWLSGLSFASLIFHTPAPRKLMLLLCMVFGLGTGVGFMLRAGDLAGDVSGMLDPFMLRVLWGSSVGDALAARGFGLGVILVCLTWQGRFSQICAALGGLMILLGFVLSGHVAAAGSLWLPGLLTLHLVVAACWAGILWPLHRLAAQDPARAGQVAHRFGCYALGAVPLMIGAGSVIAYQLLGSVAALFATTYGLLLLAKLFCVSTVLACAALNKMRFVPHLLKGRGAEGLMMSLEIEGGAMIFVLAFTASLTTIVGPA